MIRQGQAVDCLTTSATFAQRVPVAYQGEAVAPQASRPYAIVSAAPRGGVKASVPAWLLAAAGFAAGLLAVGVAMTAGLI